MRGMVLAALLSLAPAPALAQAGASQPVACTDDVKVVTGDVLPKQERPRVARRCTSGCTVVVTY